MPSESFWAEPPTKSPETVTCGASATLLLRAEVVLADDGDLVEQDGGERGVKVGDEVVFAVLVVVAGRGQRLIADALVLAGPVLIAVLHVAGMAVAELVRGANAELGVAGGRGDVGLEGAGGVAGGGRDGGAHDGVAGLLRRG